MADMLVRNGFPLFLERNERKLLSQMIVEDVRTPADQVRWLIVEEAKRRGLMPVNPSNDKRAVVIEAGGALAR